MSIINEPEVSKATASMYSTFCVFVASMTLLFFLAGVLTPMGVVGIVASVVSAFVAVIMFLILISLYRTRYILTDRDLILRTTLLIGGSKTIALGSVRSVEKTVIPLGIKLFGASFHGGYYHIPGLGRAFLTITNFKDGLLIKTDQGNFVITPSNPLGFQEAIADRKRNL